MNVGGPFSDVAKLKSKNKKIKNSGWIIISWLPLKINLAKEGLILNKSYITCEKKLLEEG